MESGIYSIINISTGKVYVGQSINVARRLTRHKSQLRGNKCHNSYLQNAFNKYGADDFSFEVLESCNVSMLDEREVYWINHFDSTNRNKGFNRECGGNANKSFSEDYRKSRTGKGNPMYGKKHTPEYVNWITKHNQGSSKLLTENDVRKIKISYLRGVSQKEMAITHNVSKSTISKIITCKNWYWVLPELENELLQYSSNEKARLKQQILSLKQDNYSYSEISKILGIGYHKVRNIYIKANTEVS